MSSSPTFLNFLNPDIELDSEFMKGYEGKIQTKKIERKEIIQHHGDKYVKAFFVKKGLLKSYVLDKNGKEHTLLFAINGWWMSDYIAIYANEKASLSVEALMDSEVIEFNAKDLDKALLTFPEFEVFQRANLEQHVVSLHRRILNQLQLSASERYDLFLEQYPDIEQHTRNYHIASYLGITQVSLSRIRVQKSKQ